MSKDDEIATLKQQVRELRQKLIEYMNYSLELDRELQTGETDDKRHNPSGNQREEIPAG